MSGVEVIATPGRDGTISLVAHYPDTYCPDAALGRKVATRTVSIDVSGQNAGALASFIAEPWGRETARTIRVGDTQITRGWRCEDMAFLSARTNITVRIPQQQTISALAPLLTHSPIATSGTSSAAMFGGRPTIFGERRGDVLTRMELISGGGRAIELSAADNLGPDAWGAAEDIVGAAARPWALSVWYAKPGGTKHRLIVVAPAEGGLDAGHYRTDN